MIDIRNSGAKGQYIYDVDGVILDELKINGGYDGLNIIAKNKNNDFLELYLI